MEIIFHIWIKWFEKKYESQEKNIVSVIQVFLYSYKKL